MAEHASTRSHALLNGLEVHWLEWGPPDGPLAVLLHGFPDTANTWRHLGPALAEEGHHVVAPWLRGYAPTGLAPDNSYQVGALAADALALADHFEADEPVLIGHDWGAIIGYAAVASRPDRWRRLVTLAVPPLGSLMSGLLSYAQIRKSWYMFVFQHPIAATVVSADDLAFINGLWADWSPGFDASDDLPFVKDSLRDPAHLDAALGYYQAMLGDQFKHDGYLDGDAAAYLPSPVPTLFLHGTNDGCMGSELTEGALSYLPAEGSQVEVLDDVGHFLHLEAPTIVNQLVTAFVAT